MTTAEAACGVTVVVDDAARITDPTGTTIELSLKEWGEVLTLISAGVLPSFAQPRGDGSVEWTGFPPDPEPTPGRRPEPVTLRIDAAAWIRFVAAVRTGVFGWEWPT